MAEDNSVQTEKVWHAAYGNPPKEYAAVYRKGTQVVLYDGSVLLLATEEQVHPSEESALLSIYEKKHVALDKAMHDMNEARKNLNACRQKGKEVKS